MSDQERPTVISARIFGEDDFTPQVYISYRTEDNARIAHAIRDWFILHLGPVNVIIDVHIPPFVESVDFYVRDKMRTCDIFVPIIGPEWLPLLHMRMESAHHDLVRIETRVALDENIAVAPVYIAGASPLREIDLPADIATIANIGHSRLDAEGNFEEAMLTIIADLKSAADRHQALLGRIDVDKHYAAFEMAMDDHNLEDALRYLTEIHDYGIIPRPFRLQIRQRIRTVKRQIQIEAGGPLYEHIADLAQTDPVMAYEKLMRFLAKYPEIGDPQNIMLSIIQPSDEIMSLIDQLNDPELKGYERLAIGRQLAELDDPRPGVGLRPDGVPDIGWIKIPEGDFIFGFDRHIELPEFFIGQYPITYSQFAAFVEDGGYEDDRWWEGLAERETEEMEQRWPFKSYPRVRVSWYAAVAYCRWLSSKTGTEVRLPTEQEWEKAARGVNGMIYPWGASYIAGYSNINEAISGISPMNLREPTAVGMFPHGQSPYGVMDMIGNVAEWCINEFSNPDSTGKDADLSSGQKRSMRGGSWSSDRLFAHTVRRRGELPTTQFNDIGFRVACYSLPTIQIK